MNLEVKSQDDREADKAWFRQHVLNNGELTIVQRTTATATSSTGRPPSPPQDEPVDFSTKRSSSKSRHGSTSSSSSSGGESGSESSGGSTASSSASLESFTSSRELKFAKNLKLIIVEILRKNPAKGRVIIRYLRYVWNRHATSRTTRVAQGGPSIIHYTAANGQPQSYVQGANSAAAGHSANAGGGNRGNASSHGGNAGSSAGGGGGSSGGGDRNYGFGGGGGVGGNGGSNGGNNGGNDGGNNGNNNRYFSNKVNSTSEEDEDEKNRRETESSQNNYHDGSTVGSSTDVTGLHTAMNPGNGSILDMDLDFDDLPTPTANSTAKWFGDHPEINTGKVISGLLDLKAEYPFSQQGPQAEKIPSDLTTLDHTTANLLQISVPDPSTTFPDIVGTDIDGGASLYDDDFSIEVLLPSTFNMNQLDVLPSLSGSGSPNSFGAHEQSMTLTNKTIMGTGENNNLIHQQQAQSLVQPGQPGQAAQAGQPQQVGHCNTPSSIRASLYPETTISPVVTSSNNNLHQLTNVGVNMNASHLRNLEPVPPSSLKPFIKTEPVSHQQHSGAISHIKKEDTGFDNNNVFADLMNSPPSMYGGQQQPPQGPGQGRPPGSPPLYKFSQSPHTTHTHHPAALAMAAMSSNGQPPVGVLQGRPLPIPSHPGPSGSTSFAHGSSGGNLMQVPPPSAVMAAVGSPATPSTPMPGPSGGGGGKMKNAGNRKRTASSQCKEEDDLSSIPSLQMRIKILQQRVRKTGIRKGWGQKEGAQSKKKIFEFHLYIFRFFTT